MYLPKILLFKSHLWSFGELCANKYADNKTNGVVGSSGRKAPIKPSIRLTIPKAINIILT